MDLEAGSDKRRCFQIWFPYLEILARNFVKLYISKLLCILRANRKLLEYNHNSSSIKWSQYFNSDAPDSIAFWVSVKLKNFCVARCFLLRIWLCPLKIASAWNLSKCVDKCNIKSYFQNKNYASQRLFGYF